MILVTLNRKDISLMDSSPSIALSVVRKLNSPCTEVSGILVFYMFNVATLGIKKTLKSNKSIS